MVCAGCGQTAAFMHLQGDDELCERCARDRRDAGVDRPVLTALDGGLTERVEDVNPVGEAYRRVADGLLRALEVAGLPEPERARLIRCLHSARRAAGLRPLALAAEPGS
jgi:hypothetical protein